MESIDSITAKSVPDAQVSLIPGNSVETQGKGVYMGTTNNIGTAEFKSVQWGAYQLQVQLPEKYSQPPITKDIVIDRAHHYFVIPVEDKGVTVSGKVVRKDTNAGVPDFPMEFRRVFTGDDYSYGVVKTDAEGNFSFHHVQPGRVNLRYYVQSEEKMDFLPYPCSFIYGSVGAIPDVEKLDFEVAGKNIEGLVYPVVPVVFTRFTGKVVDQSDNPIPDVRLTLEDRGIGPNPLLVKSIGPQPSKTDGDGKFDLMIPSGADPEKKEYALHLTASHVQVTPYKENNEPGVHVVEDTVIPLAQGEIPITFHIGDELKNLKIILNSNLFTKRVHGVVKTEDGGSLDGTSVSVSQGNFGFNAMLSSDGTFIVNGLKPGKAVLRTYSRFTEIKLERLGTKTIYDYHCEFVQLEIPPGDEPDLYVEITLKKAGYLAGMILDKNGVPIKGALVFSHGLGSESLTGSDGIFFINNVPINSVYDLTALDDKSGAILAELKGVQSNDANIIIRRP